MIDKNILKEMSEVVDHLASGELEVHDIEDDQFKEYLLDNGFNKVFKTIIAEDGTVDHEKLKKCLIEI